MVYSIHSTYKPMQLYLKRFAVISIRLPIWMYNNKVRLFFIPIQRQYLMPPQDCHHHLTWAQDFCVSFSLIR